MARRTPFSRPGWLVVGGLLLAGCRGEPSPMERNRGPAQNETAQSPGTPPPDRSSALIGAWTMDGPGEGPKHPEMRTVFRADGTGYDSDGRFRWEMRGPKTVWLYHVAGGGDGVDLDPGVDMLRDEVTLSYRNSTFISGLHFYRMRVPAR